MKRLTEKDSGLDFKLVDSDDFDTHTWCQYANEAVNRLAAYEDIGLEPDHLHELQDSAFDLGYQTCLHDRENLSWRGAEELQAYRALGTVEHLTELVKAENDGWLALLSIPMLPMVKVEGDSDVYCPRCGYDLSGSWNEYHPDQGWTMCQCPNCGQSICDTKVMSHTEAEAALGGGGDV